MKKIIFTSLFLSAFALVSVAQNTKKSAAATPSKKSDKASSLQSYDKQKQEEAARQDEKAKKEYELQVK